MKYLKWLIIGSLFLFSCKKDKLEGEKEILVGRWHWIYTVHTYNHCNPPSSSEILTPTSENKSFIIEFLEKGQVIFNEEDKKRIVFNIFSTTSSLEPKREHQFGIYLNNKSDMQLNGWIGADTLMLTGDYSKEPFEDVTCEGCCTYTNYFIRQ